MRLEGTPVGALNPEVTQSNIQSTICRPGWTASVRPASSFTNGVKQRLMIEHRVPAHRSGEYELDHFIPLALGGHPRSLDNLWLQPWKGE